MPLVDRLRRLYHRLPAPPSTNYPVDGLGIDVYDLVPSGGIVVDVGAGGTRGRYQFARKSPEQRGLRFVGVDLVSCDGTSVRADAHALPIASSSVDAVLSVSTLEYLHDPKQMVAEVLRVLKPGGVVYLSCPFVFPYHPPPDDYHRFSMAGLQRLCCGFSQIRSGFNRGPASTFCQVLVHFLAITFSFGSMAFYGLLVDLFRWCFFWVKYLDRWIASYPAAKVLHGSAFFLGRKPAD